MNKKELLKKHMENKKIWNSMTKETQEIFIKSGLHFLI